MRPVTDRELHAPVRADEVILLIVVGGDAAQVFAAQAWLAGLLGLGLLTTLAYAGRRLRQWVGASIARTERSPLLLVYRDQIVPDALAVAALDEADLHTLLRRHGVAELTSPHAIVQEPNGSLGITQPSATPPNQAIYPLFPN